MRHLCLRTMRRVFRRSSPLVAATLLACSGQVGSGPGEDPPGPAGTPTRPGERPNVPPNVLPATDGKPGPVASACDRGAPSPGPAPLRRLNNREYDATIRDLLGDTSGPAREFVKPNLVAGFDTGAEGLAVSSLLAEQLYRSGESLAGRAAAKLTTMLPCSAQGGPACAETFIRDFGGRAFRRPLTADEVARFRKVFDAGAAEKDFTTGIEWVIQAVLISPSFLHRVEAGAGAEVAPGVVRPSPHELASRLSYFLWGSMPDQALLTAAEGGRLQTAADVAREAQRMLESPKAADLRRAFFQLWLSVDRLGEATKDKKVFPAFTDAMPEMWATQVLTFAAQLAGSPAGTVQELFTAPYAYLNATLAKLYGASGPSGATFDKVMLDPQQRAGVLTQPGLLAMLSHAASSSPIERGVFVLDKILCEEIAPPPPGLDVTPPEPDPKRTIRQQVEMMTSTPACSACHKRINQIGLGLEAYDAIGAHRTKEASGLPIDARGEVIGAGDAGGMFSGGVELAKRLGTSQTVRECFSRQWFRFAFGRPEGATDACTLNTLRDQLGRGGDRVEALLLAVVQSDAFLYRQKETTR